MLNNELAGMLSLTAGVRVAMAVGACMADATGSSRNPCACRLQNVH